jgi:penicillin amidase
MRRRPLEFRLLQSDPTPWRPEDVIGVGKLVSFLLIGNWDVELARLKVLLDDGPQARHEIDPVFASFGVDEPGQRPDLSAAVDALAEDLSQFVEFAGIAGGLTPACSAAPARHPAGRFWP